MATTKEELKDFVEGLPEDISLEEVQYRLFVRQKVERGLEDVAAGRTVTSDEARRRMAEWTFSRMVST